MKTLFYNAKVYTGEGFAKAFLVNDTKIEEVYDQIPELNDCEKVDLHGHFVCAGFNDSHMHLLNFGQSLIMAKLNENTSSLQGMMEYLSDFIKEHDFSNGAWVRGRGWNQDYFEDVRRMPNKHDLDAVCKDLPIMLTRACGHCCVVNSKVLEIAKIDKDTIAPLGGAIDFDNGLFYDNAIDLIDQFIPLPDKEELKKMIEAGSKALNTYGITSCQSDD